MEFDLHIHTNFSFDGTDAPEEIVDHAVKVGLRGIAITDHDSTGAHEIALKHAGDNLVLIPAVEITLKFGDVIGYFFCETAVIGEEDKFAELKLLSDLIRAAGGLVCLPHPNREQLAELEENNLTGLFDIVEAFNARRHNLSNVLEFGGEPYIVDFAKKHGLCMTAGSDAHSADEVGSGRTIMPASTLQDVRHALVKKTTVLAGKKTGWVADLFGRFKKDSPDNGDE
jgi:hypothetical protein